ncbi:MAG: class I SAM-dependent methyltransferase, partial [Clostridia bacterium]
MALDLGSARHWARALQLEAAGTGSTCLDATMGNGGDTEALCRLVGPSGRVYAFDVQPEALESTRARLAAQGFAERARLFLLGHEHMAEVVHEPLDLIVFNLGWLPGVPDKTLTTRAQTT